MGSVVTSFKLRELFPIGSGGMGTTYLACMSAMGQFQRLVVVKRLHEHLVHDEGSEKRLLTEAQLAGFVHHAHVVGVQHVGVDERGLFLVLDFVDGASVRQILRTIRPNRLPEPIVLRLILDCLAGLQAVHEATDNTGQRLGILHRDVTTDNLLVGLDGVARVSDFGIAKSKYSTIQTAPMKLLGKLPYMAPEYIEGGPLSPAVDVYAVGISLYWMLAGRSPWPRLEEVQLLAWILSEGVPPLPEHVPVGPELREVVAKACAMDPHERYQTADEMAHALERLGPEHPIAERLRVAEFMQTTVGAASHALRERAAQALGVPSLPPAPLLDGASVTRRITLPTPLDANRVATRRISLAEVPPGWHVVPTDASPPASSTSEVLPLTGQRASGTLVGATLAQERTTKRTNRRGNVGNRTWSVTLSGSVALLLGTSLWLGAPSELLSASENAASRTLPSPSSASTTEGSRGEPLEKPAPVDPLRVDSPDEIAPPKEAAIGERKLDRTRSSPMRPTAARASGAPAKESALEAAAASKHSAEKPLSARPSLPARTTLPSTHLDAAATAGTAQALADGSAPNVPANATVPANPDVPASGIIKKNPYATSQ